MGLVRDKSNPDHVFEGHGRARDALCGEWGWNRLYSGQNPIPGEAGIERELLSHQGRGSCLSSNEIYEGAGKSLQQVSGEQKIKADLAMGGKGTVKGYSDLNHLLPLWVFCCRMLYSGGLCELSNVIKVNGVIQKHKISYLLTWTMAARNRHRLSIGKHRTFS